MDISTSKLLLAASGGAAAEPEGPLHAEDVFATSVYLGTGSGDITLTSGLDMSGQGGMVWGKSRTSTVYGGIFDSVRGANKRLRPNSTLAEQSASNILKSFNSDGVTVSAQGGTQLNSSGDKYVAWMFRKAPKFFDIVTYTGNGSGSGQTISHNLGSVPGMIIVKRLNADESWCVYHRSTGNNYFTKLESGSLGWAQNKISGGSSTSFQVMDADGMINGGGDSYVAYLFAHNEAAFGPDSNESIIHCGSYTGNANSNGPVVNVGFEPQWLLIKNVSDSRDWVVLDTMRGIVSGGDDERLYANITDSESGDILLDLTPTGFQLTYTGDQVNGSGENYIYVAIRRPHKIPTVGTDVFAMDTGSVVDGVAFTSGFAVDAALTIERANSDPRLFMSRLMGEQNFLKTDSTSAQQSGVSMGTFDHNNGWYRVASANQSWMFKRAPKFFDLVSFKGTGNSNGFSHSLGVKPEMVIFKSTTHAQDWIYKFQDRNNYLYGQSDQAQVSFNNYFDAEDTASLFYGRAGNAMTNGNNSYRYIALLFATLAGISKVGSYTGNGSYQTIDCGFSAGARFVLIKRTDASGHWHIWDSLRGITQGADPYIRLSGPAATEFLGNKNYLYNNNAGFGVQEISGTNNPNININNANYIFLAIA